MSMWISLALGTSYVCSYALICVLSHVCSPYVCSPLCSHVCALLCVLSSVLSYVCSPLCALSSVLSYVWSPLCALICVLPRALICLHMCPHLCVIVIIITTTVSPPFAPPHCLGSLAGIIKLFFFGGAPTAPSHPKLSAINPSSSLSIKPGPKTAGQNPGISSETQVGFLGFSPQVQKNS